MKLSKSLGENKKTNKDMEQSLFNTDGQNYNNQNIFNITMCTHDILSTKIGLLTQRTKLYIIQIFMEQQTR